MKNNLKTQLKKVVLAGILAIAGVFAGGAYAQTSSATSGPVTLNVIFQDYLSIEVMDGNVDLRYETPDDYTNGVDVTKDKHLKVSSSKANFTVSVKNDNPSGQIGRTVGTASDAVIQGSDVTIRATGNDFGAASDYSTVTATQSFQQIFKSNKRISEGHIDVKYSTKEGSLKGENAYKYVGNTYSTQVTYNIAVN